MYNALILAGGLGTRLRTVTGGVPKPMVEVAGMPFLYRIMKRLEASNCTRICLSLSYKADYIIQRVRADTPVNVPVSFIVEDEPLGTGGAIKYAAANFIQNEKFLVLNGDTFIDIDYWNFFKQKREATTLLCGVKVNNSGRYGRVGMDGHGLVTSFEEKVNGEAGIINSGLYRLKRSEIVNFDSHNVFSFEKEYLKPSSRKIHCIVSEGFFVDIGIPRDYRLACDYFR